MGADHLIVADHELEEDLLRQIERGHDPVVPVAGPALVHDLGLDLGQEVAGLLVDDGQEVLLPVGQIAIVVADEQEDVGLGLERLLRQIDRRRLDALVQPRERVVRRLGRVQQALALLGRLQLLDREIARAVERDRVRRVQELLDRVAADRRVLDIAAHPVGAGLERGQGLTGVGGRAEGEIVLEEVVVAVDVRDGQDLQAQGVVAHQVGEGGVGVDHHLVGQAGDAMVVHGLGLLERLAEAPVRVVRGHAVIGHVAQHRVLVADLELLRVAARARSPRPARAPARPSIPDPARSSWSWSPIVGRRHGRDAGCARPCMGYGATAAARRPSPAPRHR